MTDSPLTPYATERRGWEAWQHEYAFGVLLLFPPEPIRSTVDALRARHDPRSQASCDAHVSLTVPLPEPPTEDSWADLVRAAASVEPFDLEYGPLRHHLPHPGVVLDVRPVEELDHLRETLEARPAFARAAERRWPFRPHMTIAEFVSAERTLELMEELANVAPSGSYRCDDVAWAVPDEDFHFTERRRLQLGR